MSGAFCTVWRAMKELGKPSASVSFTSRKTSSSSMNHDFHVQHGGAEVRHTFTLLHFHIWMSWGLTGEPTDRTQQIKQH